MPAVEFVVPSVEFVVAQCDEDVSELIARIRETNPAARVTVYAKGAGKGTPPDAVRLPNVGREAHAILHHLVARYDSLADSTAFVQGGSMAHDLKRRAAEFLMAVPPTRDFSSLTLASLPSTERDFSLDEWQGQSDPEPRRLTPAEPRPFGAWYQRHVGGAFPGLWTSTSTFAVSRAAVRRRPKRAYERLLRTVEAARDPEAAHYLERSWAGLFFA